MRKSFLQSLSCGSECEKSVIILGARQFTIYDTYYVEENINITDGYLWFTQYDNHKEISLKDFRGFMSKLGSSGSFNFNDVVKFVGISFDDIPQVGLQSKLLVFKWAFKTIPSFLTLLMEATSVTSLNGHLVYKMECFRFLYQILASSNSQRSNQIQGFK